MEEIDDNYDVSVDIHETERLLKRIEKDIRKIWDNVIAPYKSDVCRSQILDRLTEDDYVKFYEFMISKNETYKKAMRLLDYLNKL